MSLQTRSGETGQSPYTSLAWSAELLGVSGGFSTLAKVCNITILLGTFWADFNRKYDHFSHMSFPDYFVQLLELQTIDWLRLPLYQGLATSTVAGTEGLIRASRLALVQCLNSRKTEQREAMLLMILKDLSTILSENLQDDRYAIPTIELLAFLVDGYIPSIPEGSEQMSVTRLSSKLY